MYTDVHRYATQQYLFSCMRWNGDSSTVGPEMQGSTDAQQLGEKTHGEFRLLGRYALIVCYIFVRILS